MGRDGPADGMERVLSDNVLGRTSDPSEGARLARFISTLENVTNDIVNAEFGGHYADNAILRLRAEPDRPRILAIELLNDTDDVRLRFGTEAGFHYSVQTSTDLHQWTTVCWNIPGTGAPREVIVAGGTIPRTFYRVVAGW